METVLISYATKDYGDNLKNLLESSLGHGIDRAIPYSDEDLEKEKCYQENQATLEHKRGVGLWLMNLISNKSRN